MNNDSVLLKKTSHPLWLSVSEAANIGGVQTKTIRRAIGSKKIKIKIIKNRYQIEMQSLIKYFQTKTKLLNKLNKYGIGQYVKKWK